ncbi:sensor histidine kinase [Cohnella soli]|uniref:Sensor histidine kinase n=1 Tax=Cohnella soli TaxID=425005 RepID=A0ABW0HN12_9BACL
MKVILNRVPFTIITICLTIIFIAINNVIYYSLTKDTLENRMESQLETLANQIQLSIENSRSASTYLDYAISQKLRSDSIAAQLALDSDVEKVSQEELRKLSSLLGIESITLLKQTKDDIVLYKSSDPKEEGVSTKTWKPWYQAFQQLFDAQKVTVNWGLSLPNFWTGPFEYSSADPAAKKIEKYGYYYDGTTNYIIDPIVSDRLHKEFEDKAGITAILNKTIQQSKEILDITAFNPVTFGTDELKTQNDKGEVSHSTPRPIIYGQNKYASEDDFSLVQKAASTNERISDVKYVNEQKVLKIYMPVSINPTAELTDKTGKPINRYVLTLVSDYSIIQDSLNSQFKKLALEIGIVSAISIFLIAIIIRFLAKARDRAVRFTQTEYIQTIDNMFASILGQRHDLLNHINTIHSMLFLKKYDALKRYVDEMVEEVTDINEIISIGQPAICALIQSKSATAIQRKINFKYDFENIKNFELGIRSVDIVKIMGNLIDNAFYAVMNEAAELQHVTIKGWVEDNLLRITVTNPGTIDELKAFEHGYTTKKGSHGVGLPATKQLVQKYRGTISINKDEPGMVKFEVSISLD